MTISNRLGITEMEATQNNRSVTVNEAIAVLEGFAGYIQAKSVGDNSPPGSPAEGDIYIVGTAGTGAFSGHNEQVAIYYNAAWLFRPPIEGFLVYAQDENAWYKYDGADWVSTLGGSGTSASISDYRANVADRLLETDVVWGAAAEVALTDAATIAVDMSTFINASVTLAGNRTLGQPSNTKVGQSGFIRIIQDGTGSRTLAYHADWKFAGGTDPVLSTAAGATDLLFYQVIAANFIYASLVKAVG
jgi:hypothetical protein